MTSGGCGICDTSMETRWTLIYGQFGKTHSPQETKCEMCLHDDRSGLPASLEMLFQCTMFLWVVYKYPLWVVV